jgi:hypothetical protein
MKQLFFFCLAAVSVFLPAYSQADVLFLDTFDRPDNTDIDASSAGMSGLLAPLTYQEVWEGSGLPTSIQILSNQLNIAMGPGMSSLFLDHNFIDNAILEADGFSVSLTVVSITAADDQPNRFAGFGVGNTRDEAMAAQDSFDSLTPFRPNTARANQGIGVSDFFVDIALDQNLRIWSNGNLLQTIPVGASAGTITVDFLVSDFNASSPVAAVVYFNGIQQTIQSFTWEHTGANYIGISGRTPAAGIFLDNLQITTFTQPLGIILVNQTEGATQVKEGGASDELTISITSSPMEYPLTITLTDKLNPAQVIISPSEVVFTAENWMTPQTITITAIDDSDMERAVHETAISLTVSTDPASPYFNYALSDIPVQIEENDCGSWGFNPADFNLDCQVNLEDFAFFVSEWIACSWPNPECQDFRPQ